MDGTTGALALACCLWLLGAAPAGLAAPAVDPSTPYQRVFPEATRFGEIEGDPPAAAAYRGDELAGYVFFTRAVIASVGFSGKPLNVLVGLDREARITGATIVEQHEPILVIGVAPEDLERFVAQYAGRDLRQPAEVRRSGFGTGGDGRGRIDAVAGATISSLVINDAILRAARAVARSRGLLGGSGGLDLERFAPATWQELLDHGDLVAKTFTIGEVETAFTAQGAQLYPPGAGTRDPGSTFIELLVGLATPAQIGRNLLGDQLYNRVTADLPEGDQLLFVAARGLYSFKGTAWRKSGSFDRLQLAQGEHTIRFTRDDHQRLDELAIEGAPELRELALFRVPAASGFRAAEPFRLELLVGARQGDGSTAFARFEVPYAAPADLIRAPPPDLARLDEPVWRQAWRGRVVDIGVLTAALLVLTAILVFQDVIVRHKRLYLALRLGFLTFTLLWLGWYASAQLSVLNVLTFAEALRTEFRWEMFLLEPLIFILWSYVAIALLFLGRGVFCGWLCPFGALQELTSKLARRAHLPQLRLPFALHERLWPIKYVVFIGLFALSLGPMTLAQQLAEVEPFKTAIVLQFARAWPFVLYALGLLALGLFVERAYCRYLCPLGAAFGIPAKIRLFEWLKRHHQCARPCQICSVECPVQAIHPDGRINPNECIYCLVCQTNYYDDEVCPPMIERRKRRARRAAITAATAPPTRAEGGQPSGA